MDATTKWRRAATETAQEAHGRPTFDWQRPLRVLRLARHVGVTPWEALAWLEDVLADVETQSAWFGDGEAGDGLPWPPDG